MKRRKVLKVALVILTIGLIWNHLPYYYCNDKAVDYISRHAGTKSKCRVQVTLCVACGVVAVL